MGIGQKNTERERKKNITTDLLFCVWRAFWGYIRQHIHILYRVWMGSKNTYTKWIIASAENPRALWMLSRDILAPCIVWQTSMLISVDTDIIITIFLCASISTNCCFVFFNTVVVCVLDCYSVSFFVILVVSVCVCVCSCHFVHILMSFSCATTITISPLSTRCLSSY